MAQLVRFVHFMAPQLTTNLVALLMRIYFCRARRIQASDGNVFAPPIDAGGIDGGLRANRPAYLLAAASLIAFGGVAALLLKQNRWPDRAW